MVILNLYRISFHTVVVLGPEHDFLFKSTSPHCVSVIVRGLRLFKGLYLMFLPNVLGATFIQGDTSIPDSRVEHQNLRSSKGLMQLLLTFSIGIKE